MSWNRPREGKSGEANSCSLQKRSGDRFPIRGAIAGAIVVVGAAVAAWWIFGSGDDGVAAVEQDRHALIKEVKPAVAPKPVVEAPKPTRPPRPKFADKPFAEMTSVEKSQMMRYWLSDTNNVIKGIDMRTRIPPPMFSNTVQNLILPYIEPAADVIPFGPIKDEEAREAIDKEIVFNFDDPDDILEKKQFVKETLQDLKKYMDAGGHAVDFFENLDHRQQLEHTAVMSCREEVRKLRDEGGDYEGAAAALEKYNEYLTGKGLPPLRMRTYPKGRKAR